MPCARLQEDEGVSLRNSALHLGVSKSNLSLWKKLLSTGIPLSHKMKRKSAHEGPFGQLLLSEDNLLCFIFELREQVMLVSTMMIIVKASILLDDFSAKCHVDKASPVKCFVKAHLLLYQMGMHESQCLPEEVAQEALEYMAMLES